MEKVGCTQLVIKPTGLAGRAETLQILTALNLIDASPIGEMLWARRKSQTHTGNNGESLYTLLKNN